MAAVSDALGAITATEVRTFDEVRSGFTHFGEGDVLWAKITPCMENGKSAVASGLMNGLGCGSTEFHVLRPLSLVTPEWVHRYMRQESYRQAARATMQSGVGQARVPKSFVERSELPLPPLNEQRRIVAKIDALQARSRRAREALDAVPALLDRFRQAVLAAAFRGDLTADWRAKHPDVEPASALLERIRVERKVRWIETEVEKARAKAKAKAQDAGTAWGPKDDASAVAVARRKAEGKYVEPEPVDAEAEGLPLLPEGWCWARLPDIGEMSRGKSRHRPRNDARLYDGGTTPFIQTGEVSAADGLLTEARTFYNAMGLEQSRLFPKGTVCITIAANIAATAILAIDACFPDSVVGVIPYGGLISPHYIEFFIRTAQADLEAFAPATAQKNINLAVLSEVFVPIAPGPEQDVLVGRVRGSMAQTATTSERLSGAAGQIDTLDQAILAKAFRGELISQDLGDEPAAVLLERIRAKRESSQTPRRRA